MSALCHCVVLALCLTVTTDLIFAQTLNSTTRSTTADPFSLPRLRFKAVPTSHSFQIYENRWLRCKVFGHPIPTIHWLKNGVRIPQSSNTHFSDDFPQYEQNDVLSMVEMGETRSRLYLDCVNVSDAGTYTCVAKTRNFTATQVHNVSVYNPPLGGPICRQENSGDRPARIYMWTKNRFEYQHVVTQLYCRAQGTPTPTISWLDVDNRHIVIGENYAITTAGDLVIRNPTWLSNMGGYTCRAVNRAGKDSRLMFLYPTLPK